MFDDFVCYLHECVRSLTIHGHAHGDAFLEAAQLALVAGDFINDAAAVIFTRIGRMKILLYCPPEETLRAEGSK